MADIRSVTCLPLATSVISSLTRHGYRTISDLYGVQVKPAIPWDNENFNC